MVEMPSDMIKGKRGEGILCIRLNLSSRYLQMTNALKKKWGINDTMNYNRTMMKAIETCYNLEFSEDD